MASKDLRPLSTTRPPSTARPPSSRKTTRPSSSSTTNNEKLASNPTTNAQGLDELASRELEYMRLNAEIQERTNALARQMESVLNRQDALFSPTKPLWTDSTDLSPSASMNFSLSVPVDQEPNYDRTATSAKLIRSSRPSSTKQQPSSQPQNRPSSMSHNKQSRGLPVSSTLQMADPHDSLHVDGIDDEDMRDMTDETALRVLKAKMKVMQEEINTLSTEIKIKSEKLSNAEIGLKQTQSTNATLEKANATLIAQVEKYKNNIIELEKRLEGEIATHSTLKKEHESAQKHLKQAEGALSAAEVRLARTNEESDKLRAALQKAKSENKEGDVMSKGKMASLEIENKSLKKQKAELINAFKKQMKLIDVLKRQKVHIEAAKVLSFTEEEFMKALDWGSQ